MKKSKIFVVTVGAVGLVAAVHYARNKQVKRYNYHRLSVASTLSKQLKGYEVQRLSFIEQIVKNQSIDTIQYLRHEDVFTYEELTAMYLYRISRMDQCDNGTNAIISVAEDALASAKIADDSYDHTQGGIYGLPIVVNDNIETKNIATSAGTVLLKYYRPKKDAAVVEKLIEKGAIILAKANLTELAGAVDDALPAGYSSVKGQTLNPLNKSWSVGGTSAGSAVAVAADLAVGAIGTGTNGGVLKPSVAMSVVSFTPSVTDKSDRVGDGLIPLNRHLDTIGVIGRSVLDVTELYNNLVDTDAQKVGITSQKDQLVGKQVGVYTKGDEVGLNYVRTRLAELGARWKNMDNLPQFSQSLDQVLLTEFKASLKNYFEKLSVPHLTGLEDLIAYNLQKPKQRVRFGQSKLVKAFQVKPNTVGQKVSLEIIQEAIAQFFSAKRIDYLVFMDDVLTAQLGLAGLPTLTIPMGRRADGKPHSLSIVAPIGKDRALLNMGYTLAKTIQKRVLVTSQK